MKMELKIVVLSFVLVTVVNSSRPPWYKPCWIYMCGLDLTDPKCAWDPRHGARLFRNVCEMRRHNFCYNRNYAVVDNDNNIAQDVALCRKLKRIVDNAEEGKEEVVQDGYVKVHFLEGSKFLGRQYRPESSASLGTYLGPKPREKLEEIRDRLQNGDSFREPGYYGRYDESFSSEEDPFWP